MVDNNDAIFNEIEEELRRERYAKLWQQYGNYIIAGAALIVAVVGGYKFWEARTLAAAQGAGARYHTALSDLGSGKTEEALKAFQTIAAEGPKGYATLAQLQVAGLHIKKGEKEQAQKLLTAVAEDTGNSQILRDYARLQAIGLNVGEADFTDIKNRLTALTGNGNPWRVNALELIAVAALDAGKLDEARETFRLILSSKDAPAGAVERANDMLTLIASKEMAATPGQSSGAAAAADQEKAKPDGAKAGSQNDQDTGTKSAPPAATESPAPGVGATGSEKKD